MTERTRGYRELIAWQKAMQRALPSPISRLQAASHAEEGPMTERTRGYRELIAWQKAMQLVPAVYRLARQLCQGQVVKVLRC